VQFDLTSIPTNTNGVPTVIVNATMKLYAYESLRQTTQAKTLTAYRLLEGWAEGTSRGSGQVNGATWQARFVNNKSIISWTIPGGYYDTSWSAVGTDDSGNNPLLAGFTTGWVHWDVTSLVQGWFANTQDPSKGFLNNGVLITINTADYLSFVSKENKNFNNSFYPQLIVTYQ